MKRRLLILAILILSIFILPTGGKVFANQSTTQTITYPVFNDLSGEYLDLTNINLFDINDSTLVYSTKSSSNEQIIIYNLKTHTQIKTINQSNVSYLKIAGNYIFMLVNGELKIISLSDYSEQFISGFNLSKNILNIAINSSSNQITICYIANNILVRLFVSNTLNLISSSQTSSEIANYFGAIALSNTHAFVTYGDTQDINKLVKIDLETTSIPGSNSYSYFPQGTSSNLVYFNHSSNEYLISIAKFSDNSTISLIRTNLNQGEGAEFQAGNEAVNDNGVYELNTITFPTDVKIINNQIHICDKGTKTIRVFNITISDSAKLTAYKTIVGGEFAENGWFSNIVNITSTTSNTIYFADYKNNRVQCIQNGVLKTLSNEDELQPSNVEFLESKKSLFYVFKTSKISSNQSISIISNSTKLTFNQYVKNNNILIDFSNIHSSTNAHNTFYALVNEGIICYNAISEKFVLLDNLPEVFKNFNETSKIEYIPAHDVFVILVNSNIYLANSSFELLNPTPLQVNNITDLATTQNHVYTLSGNYLSKYSVNYDSNSLKFESSIMNNGFQNITSLSANKKSGVLYGFDSKQCCIKSIINCDFNLYRTFSKAITLNLNVAVYANPTTLPIEDSSIIIGKLPIGKIIDLYSTEIINFAGNQFYAIIVNSNIYYVNVNDVDFYSSERIVHYKAPNAKISANEPIKVYASANKSEIIDELDPNTEIITQNFNESNEFTKILYYNELNELCEGYIITDYINTFNLSKTEIIAIALVGLSVPIIICLFVLYYKISKKKSKNLN